HPAGIPARPFATRLDNLAGNVFLHPDQNISVDVAALPPPDLAQNFHIVGLLGPGAKRIDAWVTANGLNLPLFGARFLPPSRTRRSPPACSAIPGCPADRLRTPRRPERSPCRPVCRTPISGGSCGSCRKRRLPLCRPTSATIPVTRPGTAAWISA